MEEQSQTSPNALKTYAVFVWMLLHLLGDTLKRALQFLGAADLSSGQIDALYRFDGLLRQGFK